MRISATGRNILLTLTVLLGAAFVSAQSHVLNGIDVLERDHFSVLKQLTTEHGGHLRLAIMTNHSGLDLQGRRTVDILATDAAHEVPGLSVVRLFSPEHGFHGALDQKDIGNDLDQATGLQVISVYGATDVQRRPSKEQLAGIDAVVIDLQDVGVHFYTYETVVGYFVEAASGTDLQVIVLDRPNPINGVAVEGPISSPGRENYVNYMSEPIRQGLTMGELATYFKATHNFKTHLTVVRMDGWKRTDWFDQTGLPWINPSPNLRSLRSTILYPGTGLLESTNLSVGRGTDTPFEMVGAPWLDAVKAASYLNARHIPGVSFIPVQFTPGLKYPFHGELCHGIEFFITNRDLLNSPELGLEVAAALYKLYPETFLIDKIDRLLLNQAALDALKAGKDPREVVNSGSVELQKFKQARVAALLYK
jgi:uncharacterized protein YbbC (DUF1343 family)